MMAQGETLGMFHLQVEASSQAGPGAKEESPFHRQLALTVADQIGLALSNTNLRETLRNQAIRDPLTGLFNRRYIEETLEREIHRADRMNNPVAAILLDIDHFKQFNDTFGHEAGDLLLQSVGRLLATNTRAEDIACRLGGDEFFVVMPDAPVNVALARAESLREAVRALKIQHQHQTLKGVTISAGIASFPEHGRMGKTVMRAADTALYQAKAEGRNRASLAASIAPA
jgi:diguanylate cyclase (GGDEF)-like protein